MRRVGGGVDGADVVVGVRVVVEAVVVVVEVVVGLEAFLLKQHRTKPYSQDLPKVYSTLSSGH